MSLWNNSILQFLKSQHSPRSVHHMDGVNKEASFYIRHVASLTAEAAVVIPLFCICLLALLYFFRILQVQMLVEEALIAAGRRVAVESCVVDDATGLFLSAETFMLLDLKEEAIIEEYVDGGALGVVLLGSSFEEDKMVLRAWYKVRLPVQLLQWDGIQLWNSHTFYKWKPVVLEKWVYITETGSVYHVSKECRTINLKIASAKLARMEGIRGENGQKYFPCYRCTGQLAPHTNVYYTAYGELYHGTLECSAIKRTVSRILKEEIGDRKPCSVCGE